MGSKFVLYFKQIFLTIHINDTKKTIKYNKLYSGLKPTVDMLLFDSCLKYCI